MIGISNYQGDPRARHRDSSCSEWIMGVCGCREPNCIRVSIHRTKTKKINK